MRELIERLRSVKWDVIDDGDRMPDDPTQKCVFVDMRPDEFESLLSEVEVALAQQPAAVPVRVAWAEFWIAQGDWETANDYAAFEKAERWLLAQQQGGRDDG